MKEVRKAKVYGEVEGKVKGRLDKGGTICTLRCYCANLDRLLHPWYDVITLFPSAYYLHRYRWENSSNFLWQGIRLVRRCPTLWSGAHLFRMLKQLIGKIYLGVKRRRCGGPRGLSSLQHEDIFATECTLLT